MPQMQPLPRSITPNTQTAEYGGRGFASCGYNNLVNGKSQPFLNQGGTQ